MESRLRYKEDYIQEARAALRPYQVEAVDTMIRDKRHLNYMPMGMGKGLVTLLAVMELQAFPCMIVCNKSAMGVLEEELKKWFDEEAVLYVGKPKQRAQRWADFVNKGTKFIITNYALAAELGSCFGLIEATNIRGSKASGNTNAKATTHPGTPNGTKRYKWNVGSLIADEIQLGGLFNHKTKTYQVFGRLAKEIPAIFLLTGTPYRRGCIDLYGPLSLVDPEEFDSYWKFVGRYCRTIDDGFGKAIERNPRDIPRFRQMLRKYATIINKEEHLKDLPGKQRIPVPLEMDEEQARVYRELETDLFSLTDTGEMVISPGVLAASVRLRQLLAAPQVLGLKSRGAAIDYLLDAAEDLVGEGKPFVVFTPFKGAVDSIREALREKFATLKVNAITGGLKNDEFTRQWKEFQAGVGASVLICSIKSAASFHATRADTAFFLGYEWDFNQNEQAEDRLNRIGQKRLVNCYYLMHKNTIDEAVIQRLNDKKYASDLVLAEEQTFQLMLKKHQEKLKA